MSIKKLHEPADILQLTEGASITNLKYAVWCSRSDLQLAFDLNTFSGQEAFIRWCDVSLLREYGIGTLNSEESADYKSSGMIIPTNGYHRLVRLEKILKRVSAVFPFKYRAHGKRYWYKILARFAIGVAQKQKKQDSFNSVIASQSVKQRSGALPGVNLIGYVFAESGMGEHVRMSAASFATTSVNYGVVNFDYGVPSRKEASLRFGMLESSNLYKSNIFHINADQMLHVYAKLGEAFFSDALNISYPFWELSKFPTEWVPFLKVMDEVWAPTRFIQDSISNALGKSVRYMPVGIELPLVMNRGRRYFGIPEKSFVFLVTFDFYSYIHRKNPWATVRAFILAFPRKSESVCLVVKVMNVDESCDDWQLLVDIARRDKRIILINKVMTIDELLSLKLSCDCYVSLHRAEGLGRGPMEAMLLGKPTILTNYSGSTDYAREDNSCLVNYSLIPIQEGQYVHFKDQVWADPDIEHAAWHMSNLANNINLANDLGEKARQFITDNFSPVRCGELYSQRLCELGVI